MMSSANHFTDQVIQPLLTELSQIQMAYSYWLNHKTNEHAVFDIYFQKNPFKGEYAVFAGVADCINFIQNFRFSEDDMDYVKSVMDESTKPEFFEFLANISTKVVTVSAIPEGTVVFPKIPLMRIDGPLAIVTLLECTLLNLINFASLVTTNASRFRIAAGSDKVLLEFGLRRAQGPDGGLSASKYCYMGGFNGTSNVLAGKVFGIPVKGTHAHAYISSFQSGEELPQLQLLNQKSDEVEEFAPIICKSLEDISELLGFPVEQIKKGELAAFACYATSYPSSFLALVDTYDVLRSGILNFIAVSLALNKLGYRTLGIRIDSGDLAYLSKEIRRLFRKIGDSFKLDWFAGLIITASNDINEDTLYSLGEQGHDIDAYGIGTHIVTCQKQPSFGCMFQLTELNGDARMNYSEDIKKVTIPGKTNVYRLYGSDGLALVDLVTSYTEEPPLVNKQVLARHVITEAKRSYVIPSKVETLLKVYWKDGVLQHPLNTLEESRSNVRDSIARVREDHLRRLNPTPYKVSVTNKLYQFMHEFWLDCAQITELK